MDLQTKSDILPLAQNERIRYKDKILFLGSCFADEIGAKMSELRFDSCVNPFGVLFNPASIAASINLLLSTNEFSEDVVVKNKDTYYSWMHSGRFASLSKTDLMQTINSELIKTNLFFKESTVIVVSFGTSWVYRYIKGDFIVANCHKNSGTEFRREFLQPEDTFFLFDDIIRKSGDKKWIFTVSPVRHLKDGAHGNQLSKSSLHLAIDKLQREFSNVYYFPAFEILNDELRDYRFYATDMLHPSTVAVDYIWQIFMHNFIDKSEMQLLSKIERLNAMYKHRALFQEGEEYKSFVAQRNRLEEEIVKEINIFRQKIV